MLGEILLNVMIKLTHFDSLELFFGRKIIGLEKDDDYNNGGIQHE